MLQILGTNLEGERNHHQVGFEFHQAIPMLDGLFGRTFQDGGEALDQTRAWRTERNAVPDGIDQSLDIHGLDENLVRLEQDGLRSRTMLGNALSSKVTGRRIGVAHGADHGEAIAGRWACAGRSAEHRRILR